MARITRLILVAICVLMIGTTLNPSDAQAACSNPAGNAGNIFYNSSAYTFQYCNDSAWVIMNFKRGSGSGGCLNPTLAEGGIVYNIDYRVLQGCAGNVHRGMGPSGGQLDWKQISVGYFHACGIKSDGTAWCWGEGDYGRLGTGNTTDQTLPTLVSGGYTWKSISAGYRHTCAIRSNDEAYCWGSDANDKLGDGGTTTDKNIPTLVSGGYTWKKVSAGYDHSCGIRSNDEAWCWGSDAAGQLGNGAGGSSNVPTIVSGGYTWKDIAVGRTHSCGIRSDDSAYCWGDDSMGQIGNGGVTGTQTTPYLVSGGYSWKSIKTGESHSCAIRSDDKLMCWGDNSPNGQLGDDTTTDRTAPVSVYNNASYASLAAGAFHTCAVRLDGVAECWGDNASAELGNGGDQADIPRPGVVLGGYTWQAVAAGNVSSCGILTNGAMMCWGVDRTESDYLANATLGNGAATAGVSLYPYPVGGGGYWKSFYSLGRHSCGLRLDGTAECTGWNVVSQAGVPYVTEDDHVIETPRPIVGGHAYTVLSGTGNANCGIRESDSAILCWGWDNDGLLGNGAGGTSVTPTVITGGGVWKKLSMGGTSACAIKSDDTLWCWGGDVWGQLGNGAVTTTTQQAPIQIGSDTWAYISLGGDQASSSNTCGIKSDGSAWCWGRNNKGQLGNGTTGGQSDVPVAVVEPGPWASVITGGAVSCGIKAADQSAWCWGVGDSGEMGNGVASNSNVPVPVSGGYKWKMLATAARGNCGITDGDQLYCWGRNTEGQIGDGTKTNRLTPVPIKGGGLWSHIAGNDSTASFCATSKTGQAYCWGPDGFYTFGNPFTTGRQTSPGPTYCSTPEGQPGALIYNSSSHVMQYS